MLNIIESFSSIGIVTHINPDPDAIGSGLALYKIIKLNYPDKRVNFYVKEKVSEYFNFLDTKELVEIDGQKCDLLISVDCGSVERIEKLNLSYNKLYNIDHHLSNNNFGDWNVVDTNACSTCEILIDLFQKWNLELNRDIAEHLYTGIMSDTGRLSWGSIREELFNKLAFLQKYGIRNEFLAKKIFNTKSEANLRIIGYALSTFHVIEEFKLSYLILTKDIFEKFNASYDDAEGIIEEMKSLKGYEIFLLIKEKDGMFRCSLRSNNMDVNKMSQIFNGGGHKKASGFVTNLKTDEIIDKILNYLRGV